MAEFRHIVSQLKVKTVRFMPGEHDASLVLVMAAVFYLTRLWPIFFISLPSMLHDAVDSCRRCGISVVCHSLDFAAVPGGGVQHCDVNIAGIFFAPVMNVGRDSLELISVEAQELMRVGLVDHVHWTIVAEKWKEFLSFEHMKEETGRSAMGPEFIGLIPLLKDKLGSNFQIVQGHRCVTNHRRYVHVILTGGKKTILSLVITEKNGEAFNHADIAATMVASGVPLYRANEGQLEIAGFETNRYLAYVVSNLDRDGSLKVASNLAPPVYEFLRRLEA